MSKIVILNAKLGAPQILEDLLQKVAVTDPSLAVWIRQVDTLPLIEGCIVRALDRLCQIEGIKKSETVFDYSNNAYAGSLAGALQSEQLPKGLGVKLNGQGVIEFVADDYRSEWKKEIKRLRELFTDAFLAESTAAILNILNYKTEVLTDQNGKGEYSFSLEGVKQ